MPPPQRPPRARAPHRATAPGDGYFERSTRPLHVLAFLLPALIACEVGTLLYLTDDAGRVPEAVSAYLRVLEFFELFGAFGIYLPALALVTVLLVQHILRRDPWSISPIVPPVMLLESAVLVAPLLVLGFALGPAAPPPAAAAAGGILAGPWPKLLTVAMGAGLYEEFLFRMVLIAIVHTLLVDVVKAGEGVGAGVAVAVSALAFAAYHNIAGPSGIDLPRAAFFALAGAYFGVLFLWRGFGIVVGAHILYDAVVLLLYHRAG